MDNKQLIPCKDCSKRFLGCHDNCPKDAQGEFGYKAWKESWRKEQDDKRKLKEFDYRTRKFKAIRCKQNEKWY